MASKIEKPSNINELLLAYHNAEISFERLAKQLYVSESTLLKWYNQFKKEKNLPPKTRKKFYEKKKKTFAIYQGDNFVDMGTIKELSQKTGLKPRTLLWYCYCNRYKSKQHRYTVIETEE